MAQADETRSGQALQGGELVVGEAAFRADQNGPGRLPQSLGLRRRQRFGDRKCIPSLGADQKLPLLRPGIDQFSQGDRGLHRRNRQTLALLGRLAGVSRQPVRVDPVHCGKAGHDRVEFRAAEFRRLFDQKVDAPSLDRREQQPEVGFRTLGPALLGDGEGSPAFSQPLERRRPFAVAPVEEGNPRPDLQAQDGPQEVRAAVVQANHLSSRKVFLDMQARGHLVLRPVVSHRLSSSRVPARLIRDPGVTVTLAVAIVSQVVAVQG